MHSSSLFMFVFLLYMPDSSSVRLKSCGCKLFRIMLTCLSVGVLTPPPLYQSKFFKLKRSAIGKHFGSIFRVVLWWHKLRPTHFKETRLACSEERGSDIFMLHLLTYRRVCCYEFRTRTRHESPQTEHRVRLNALQRVSQELDYRIDICCVTKGAHIEHL
jgi:hypothetical protein